MFRRRKDRSFRFITLVERRASDPLADGGIRGVDILLLEKSSGVLGEKKIAILNHGRDRICGAISGS